MSGICAFYGWNGVPCDRALLASMEAAMANRGEFNEKWSEGAVGLAVTKWRDYSKLGTPLAYCFDGHNFHVAADIRLDNREELLKLLRGRDRSIDNPSDSALLAAAYFSWGEECLRYLRGDFAFVIWSHSRQRLFAARSPTGLRPLVYHSNRRRLICASEPRQILRDPTVANSLNPEWVSTWLVKGVGHWDGTIYSEIDEITPGHALVASQNGLSIWQFWKPYPRNSVKYNDQRDYVQHFKTLFTEAVKVRTQSERPVLMDLSGGLDSSSVVCTAAQLAECDAHRLHALHIFSDTWDEIGGLPYVKLVKEKYNINVSYLESGPEFEGSFESMPWLNHPSTPLLLRPRFSQALANLGAELGARAYLTGDFGDSLFMGRDYLTQCWNEQRLLQFAGELRRWRVMHGISPLSLCYAAITKPFLQRRNPSLNEPDSAPWMRPKVWQLNELRQRKDDEYFAMQCPDPFSRALFKEMRLHSDFAMIQGERELAAGLETRQPFRDIRLLEFLLATIPQYQMRFDQTKYLLRAAMDGILPEDLRLHTDKRGVRKNFYLGVARNADKLEDLVSNMPEMLREYIDPIPLVETIRGVSQGSGVHNTRHLGCTLSLILWSHRLPWADGNLPVADNPTEWLGRRSATAESVVLADPQ